jgi:hypothetical protein
MMLWRTVFFLFLCAVYIHSIQVNSESFAEEEITRCLLEMGEDPNWTLAEDLTVYTPDNLFEYLNGAAPQYLAFGFRKLLHVRYAYGGNDLLSVTLDVFEMGTNRGAYGLYTSGRHRSASIRSWGVEGYRSGAVAAGWRHRVYVHASADEESPQLTARLEEVVARVLEIVPGERSSPELIRLLPKGFLRNTDRYVGKDLFGHSFLPGGFVASYQQGTHESRLFLCRFDSPEEASAAFTRLRSYEDEHGEVLTDSPELEGTGFWAQDPGLGLGLVSLVQRDLAGIWEVTDREDALRLIRELRTNLRSPDRARK